MPHTPPDVANWLAVGYTSEKMLDAGKQIIDTTMAAFPSQQVTMAVAGNGDEENGNSIPTRTTLLATRSSPHARLGPVV